MTTLAVPDVRLHESWAATVRDFGGQTMHGSGWSEFPPVLLRDLGPEACGRAVTILARRADVSVPPEGDLVHSDYFWITDGEPGTEAEEVVGFIAVRHGLNDFLLNVGGHIGYSVRPSRRRQGHAVRALVLSLGRAGELGVDPALVTCDEDNVGSRRTIEAAAGVLEDVRDGKRRYWVSTQVTRPGPGDSGVRRR